MEIGRIDLLSNTHLNLLALLAHQICEGPVNRLPRQTVDSTGDLELTGTRRATHFKPIETDLGVVVYRRGIHRSWGQRVERDHVSSSLFRHADELLFSRFVIDQ